MKLKGLNGEYDKIYTYLYERRKDNTEHLTYEQKKHIIEQAKTFKTNYRTWFLSAQKIFENAIEQRKATEEQYVRFLERQNYNIDAIKEIFEKVYTGELYFDVESFEKDYQSRYESKDVYREFSRMKSYALSLENTKNNSLEKADGTDSEEVYEEISIKELTDKVHTEGQEQ